MNPANISCPKCGRFFPRGESCPSNECKEDSTSFLGKVVKERKSYDESANNSTNTDSGFTTYATEEIQDYFLDQTDSKLDSSHLCSPKQDPLINEGNPSTSPSSDGNSMEGNQEELLEVTVALGDSFEKAPEFLPILQADSLYSDESTTVFSQAGNPLDELQFQLVADDSSASNQRKDKIVKTTDSSKKQGESSPSDLAKAIRELRIETTSKDYCGGSALNSLPGNSELQSTFEDQIKTRSKRTRSKRKTHSKSKSKKSPLKHSPKKRFQCGECGMILSTKESCKRHQLLLHIREKPFECKDCGHSFSFKYSLNNHYRTHSEERPFKCNICLKKFKAAVQLKKHFCNPTGEKSFMCITCGRKFSNPNSLCNHRRRFTH